MSALADIGLVQWALAAAVFGVVALALATLRGVLRRRLPAWAARTAGKFDDVVVAALQVTGTWFVLAVALLAGAQALALPPDARVGLARLFALVAILQTGIWANAAVGAWLRAHVERRSGDPGSATIASVLGVIARVALWSVVVLVMLDNVGVDVTALVASLGIGGVAVALALQNILGDLFASLAIALDKPLVIGDFIITGDVMGTVVRVGLKTTHLRSLSGELIVLSNSDLLGSRIRNYKRMSERRVLFGFGVTYDTPGDQLERIPVTVREIVEAQALARFDRAHFARLGESAFEFEVVYYVKDADYNRYMDVQQAINLRLVAAMQEAGVGFAFPTRTLHLVPPAEAS